MTHSFPEPIGEMDLEHPQADVSEPESAVNDANAMAIEGGSPALSTGPLIPERRQEWDFKATKPKKSSVLSSKSLQDAYDRLFTGSNKSKMGDFKFRATATEVPLVHAMTEGPFKHVSGRTAKKGKGGEKKEGDMEVEEKKDGEKKDGEKKDEEKKDGEKKDGEKKDEENKKKRKREDPAEVEPTNGAGLEAASVGKGEEKGLILYPGGVVVPKNVKKHPARSNAGARAVQILRHISEVMLSQLGRGDTGAVEVESMYVSSSNTMVVAANNLSAIDSVLLNIEKDVKRDLKFDGSDSFLGDLIRLVAVHQEKLSYRDKTAMAKIAAAVGDKRAGKFGTGDDGDDARQLVELLKKNGIDRAPARSHTQIADLLNGNQSGIFLMHTAGVHAEQQLLRALLASKLRGHRAIIRGARNPCFGCFLLLKYAHEKLGADQLSYGTDPGFLWHGSMASGAAIAAEDLLRNGLLDADKVAEYNEWVQNEVRTYESSGAHGSVPIRNRNERRDSTAGGTNAQHSRAGLSAEGYGDASSSDDEDVNPHFRAEVDSTIDSLRSGRGIEPRPRKQRKLDTEDTAAPRAEDPDPEMEVEEGGSKKKRQTTQRKKGRAGSSDSSKKK